MESAWFSWFEVFSMPKPHPYYFTDIGPNQFAELIRWRIQLKKNVIMESPINDNEIIEQFHYWFDYCKNKGLNLNTFENVANTFANLHVSRINF